MKIVNITGGLGNQMFQYAFALALKHQFPKEKVLIDIQHYNSLFFKKFKGINLHNGFELNDLFPNAPLKIANSNDIRKVSYWIPNYVISRIARRLLPKKRSEYVAPYSLNYSFDEQFFRDGDCYYEGYWQSPKYFKEIKDYLKEIFSHPLPNEYNFRLIEEITNCNSVGIHVRRGDYLKEPEFRGLCGINYYKNAIDKITEEVGDCKFFIFSNDLKWCEENLVPLFGNHDYVFVSGNKGKESFWDMFLMTYCKYLIIANSSFSWWGAYLSKNADKVFAPYPWLNRACKIEIYEDDWIQIDCRESSPLELKK
ncbi:MAG: alpha-1,2-fucosyltransferase [Muribaculaceae bacterium]|nr:alpha-1,2-fucosyltransferase [Muribaculaceae bacterium]